MTKKEFETATIKEVYQDLSNKYSHKELADLYDEIIHELLNNYWNSFSINNKIGNKNKEEYITYRYKELFTQEVIDDN